MSVPDQDGLTEVVRSTCRTHLCGSAVGSIAALPARVAKLMLLARRNKWLAVLLVLMCHELVIAQDGDAEYFAGISGTETKSSGIVSNWAATMGAIDGQACRSMRARHNLFTASGREHSSPPAPCGY